MFEDLGEWRMDVSSTALRAAKECPLRVRSTAVLVQLLMNKNPPE